MSEPSVEHSDPRPPAEIHYQRAPRSWRSRFRADYRHWVRRTFSRESYVNSLKALLWVVPLSALVWSYAFNEELVPTPTINVTLTVGQDADRVVRFASGERRYVVEAKLEGPQKDVPSIEEHLRNKAVNLDVDRSLGNGRHTIDVKSALNRDSQVVAAGMTVESCVPPVIDVDVDSIAERTVEVRPPPDIRAGVLATFNPPKVKIFGPSQDLERADPHFVYANLKPFSALLATPGKHVLDAVQLEMPEKLGNSISLSPGTVSGTVDVTESEDSYTILSIPVYHTLTAQVLNDNYHVKYEASLPSVTVAGPKAIIDIIRQSGQLPVPYAVYAEFLVDISNPTEQHVAPLMYPDLPPGVTVTDKPRTITYSLELRKDQ